MICILEVEPPGIPARTLSTLLHTLSTDPLRMWNVRVLKPISHWRPRLAFLQLPLLQETKGFFFILHLNGKIIVNLTDMFIWLGGEIDCVYMKVYTCTCTWSIRYTCNSLELTLVVNCISIWNTCRTQKQHSCTYQ